MVKAKVITTQAERYPMKSPILSWMVGRGASMVEIIVLHDP